MGAVVRKVDPGDLVGVAELAEMFGLRRTTVSGWYTRRSETGFPEAVARLNATPVFSRTAVLGWWRDWVPVKGAKVGTDPGNAEESHPGVAS